MCAASFAAKVTLTVLPVALRHTIRLQARHNERSIPFLVYSGFEVTGEPHLSKPATPRQLIEALEKLVGRGS